MGKAGKAMAVKNDNAEAYKSETFEQIVWDLLEGRCPECAGPVDHADETSELMKDCIFREYRCRDASCGQVLVVSFLRK